VGPGIADKGDERLNQAVFDGERVQIKDSKKVRPGRKMNPSQAAKPLCCDENDKARRRSDRGRALEMGGQTRKPCKPWFAVGHYRKAALSPPVCVCLQEGPINLRAFEAVCGRNAWGRLMLFEAFCRRMQKRIALQNCPKRHQMPSINHIHLGKKRPPAGGRKNLPLRKVREVVIWSTMAESYEKSA
jgi:hypothetical protein